MNRDCEIVQDLLPLYVDGICSHSSAELVETHVRDCEICQSAFEKMNSDTSETILKEEKGSVLVRHEKWEIQKFLKSLITAIGVIYFPFVFIYAYMNKLDLGFISANYWFSLAAYFLITFPYYLSLIELTRFIFRTFDRKKRSVGEVIWNTVSTLLAASILVVPHDYENRLLLILGLALVLVFVWIFYAIIYKRKPKLRTIIAEKSFWCCFFVLALICLSVFAFSSVQFTQAKKTETVTVNVHEYGSECEGVSLKVDAEELREWHWDHTKNISQISVRWVNETETNLEYHAKGWLYRSVGGSEWKLLASTDASLSGLQSFDLAPNSSHVRSYRLDLTELETGRYKFVTLIDGKEVWFTFYVMVEMKTYG